MNMVDKIINALEKLRSARNVEILLIKLSISGNDEITMLDGKGYDIELGKKYVSKISSIDVYIDPYISRPWAQIYYKTPVSSCNTITVTGDS